MAIWLTKGRASPGPVFGSMGKTAAAALLLSVMLNMRQTTLKDLEYFLIRMHHPKDPFVPSNRTPSGIRTVAMHILFLVLSPCSAMEKLRMTSATMETPTPLALVLCVGYGK